MKNGGRETDPLKKQVTAPGRVTFRPGALFLYAGHVIMGVTE
jgi:hypothetical protein